MFPALERPLPVANRLLLSFSAEEYARLSTSMRHVNLRLGQVLYECDEQIDYLYFPTASVVSFLYTMRDGSTAEMAVAGNDGVVDVAAFLGAGHAPHRAVTQIGGHALKLPTRVLQQEFARGGQLQHVLLRYTQALITQISQTSVCNRLHPLEQRLCRWLLSCHDRVNGSDILMTQELLANMLGGRRETVTVAAGRLQDAGLIYYSRGRIKILNRTGLETMVCECYKVVDNESNRLVGIPGKHILNMRMRVVDNESNRLVGTPGKRILNMRGPYTEAV
jgi:CRP-like cAMP-binding protein